MSHSWHDDGELKWKALKGWAKGFKRKHKREPLLWLDAGCLDAACLQRSFFDPLPTADGRACATRPAAAAIAASPFFQSVDCVGAFGDAHPQSNWLAGWSTLFPTVLGANAFSAVTPPPFKATCPCHTS